MYNSSYYLPRLFVSISVPTQGITLFSFSLLPPRLSGTRSRAFYAVSNLRMLALTARSRWRLNAWPLYRVVLNYLECPLFPVIQFCWCGAPVHLHIQRHCQIGVIRPLHKDFCPCTNLAPACAAACICGPAVPRSLPCAAALRRLHRAIESRFSQARCVVLALERTGAPRQSALTLVLRQKKSTAKHWRKLLG